MTSFPGQCRFGMRLTNNLKLNIKSLSLRFQVFKKGDIPFEHFTRSFIDIKPTLSQYKDVNFVELGCDEIDYMKVEGTRGCQAGNLTFYTSTAEQCLELVDVKPSDIVKISK